MVCKVENFATKNKYLPILQNKNPFTSCSHFVWCAEYVKGLKINMALRQKKCRFADYLVAAFALGGGFDEFITELLLCLIHQIYFVGR